MNDKIQVLCYGDSNTWGCIGRWKDLPIPSERFDAQHRWPSVLQSRLGDDYNVISEGLCGRTTIYYKDELQYKSGEYYLLPCLITHRPLDIVVIMLGTNDLQIKKDITEEEMPIGISKLVDIIQDSPQCGRGNIPPEILLIAPPEIKPSHPDGRVHVYAKFRGDIGRDLSLKFPQVYKKVADEKHCFFLNGADYAEPGPADGVHIDADSHVRLASAVAEAVKRIFQNK